jgi:hypothetical protein
VKKSSFDRVFGEEKANLAFETASKEMENLVFVLDNVAAIHGQPLAEQLGSLLLLTMFIQYLVTLQMNLLENEVKAPLLLEIQKEKIISWCDLIVRRLVRDACHQARASDKEEEIFNLVVKQALQANLRLNVISNKLMKRG